PGMSRDTPGHRGSISPGIPLRLLPLTARAGVALDRAGRRFLKLSRGDILDGSTPDRLALRRSAGGSGGCRGFLIRRGHARRRLLAPHCTPPFASPTSQISWWSWAAILIKRSGG